MTDDDDDDDNVIPFQRPFDPAEVVAVVGGLVDKSGVVLAIYGDDLDPDEVSAKLGVQPSSAHRRGDRPGKGPPYSSGAWLLERRGSAPIGPQELLVDLMAVLPIDDAAVWTELRSRYSVRLWLQFTMMGWNRGFEIDGELMQRLSGVVHRFDFDLYSLDEEDEE